jgi:hypothetical protein
MLQLDAISEEVHHINEPRQQYATLGVDVDDVIRRVVFGIHG